MHHFKGEKKQMNSKQAKMKQKKQKNKYEMKTIHVGFFLSHTQSI